MSALSVMVVEDHGFQRRMALRLLSELNVFEASEAADGASALRQLQDRAAPVDVVMVDLDMPGMDGIEFIGHLAQGYLARSVLVVSALDPALLMTVQTMARAYGLNVLGTVEKPLTLDNLSQALLGFDDPVIDVEIDDDVEIGASTIHEAMDAGEILPWFQPQAEFDNGKVVAVEALARWLRLKEPGWQGGLAINIVGVITTGLVAFVVGLTNFTRGAWIVLLLIPILILMFLTYINSLILLIGYELNVCIHSLKAVAEEREENLKPEHVRL